MASGDTSELQTSRLIVKNLPSDMSEDKVKIVFKQFGDITDICLKYTKQGVFRKFAFVGYKTIESAKKAIKSLHKSFIKTSRLHVEFAANLGDTSKPRAWSKYSKDSSAFKERHAQSGKASTPDKNKKGKVEQTDYKKELYGELYKDPEFREFLTVTKNESRRQAWSNDTSMVGLTVTDGDGCAEAVVEETDKPKTKISDLDYLKTKMTKAAPLADEGQSSSVSSPIAETFAIKMRGFQGRMEKESIREFFAPICIRQIKIPHSSQQKCIGIAYVYFPSEAERTQALGRNKNFIGTRRIFVSKCRPPTDVEPDRTHDDRPRAWDLKSEKPEETLAESGRLFIRNLAYSCTEDDLQQLFMPFGPLTEVHVPIDTTTKKIKGFAYVTFMMPEHAVAAFGKLDGTVFQGRMLHLLASHDKKETTAPSSSEGSAFKNKRASDQKKQSASSHNWNSLFLGANAVADTMAEKYRTSKAHILDKDASGGLGVRMALGETQVVADTRAFLLKNGVSLDSFSQAAGKRSKTSILVKNLPSTTTKVELDAAFAPFGTLGRIVLPPSGVTAIVEFMEPSEARRAFKQLAYTKFQHVPLYLEWAPVGVFTTKPDASLDKTPSSPPQQNVENIKGDKLGDDGGDDKGDDPEEGATLSVKNFNFSTKEEQIKQLFERCGRVVNVTIAKKKDIKNPGVLLPMGYGFVQYERVDSMNKALKTLQHTVLDGHALELRVSNRTTHQKPTAAKRKQIEKKQATTKILVRNIPFEAKPKEVAELFRVFGQLKYVRIPKKVGGPHRGFGFVDFLSKQDAKRAFDALCHSTHLYGRRLVLEWADDVQDLDELRQKTAENFQPDAPAVKKLKKSSLVNDLKAR